MGLFGNLKTDGLEKQEDRVGGGNGWLRDTDIYTFTIKAAYAGKSTSSQAQSVTLIGVDTDGKEYRETFWITNGKGENFFMSKDRDGKETGKRAPLPGFNIINDICMICTDKPLADQTDEEKVFKVYDPEAKAEVPKAVPMLVELLGKEVSLAIYRQLENKTAKSQTSGKYEPIADTREINTVEKALFPQYRCTVREAEVALENGAEVKDDGIYAPNGDNVGIFWDAWLEAHKGKVRDKRSIKDGEAGQSGRPGGNRGAPPQSGGNAASGGERKSLFNKG